MGNPDNLNEGTRRTGSRAIQVPEPPPGRPSGAAAFIPFFCFSKTLPGLRSAAETPHVNKSGVIEIEDSGMPSLKE
jgi:hypothetical protein